MADTSPALSERFALEVELSRDLGLLAATSVIVGGIIGSGIFGAPAGIAQQVGSPGLFMLVWVVGGVLSFCGAVCFAELGAMMPRTGGQFIYLREVYPPLIGFLYGWTEVFMIQCASMAAVAFIFTSYLGFFFTTVSTGHALFSVAGYTMMSHHFVMIFVITALGAINYFGVRFGGFVQTVFTISKVAALIGLVVIVVIAGGKWVNFTPLFPENPQPGIAGAFGSAMIGAMFAYNGWHNASMVAGEIKDPQRRLPQAILIGLSICVIVYLSVNWSYLYVMTVGEVAGSDRVAADVAERVIGPFGGAFVSLAVMVSTFGTINTGLLAAPRISYAMAKEGLFFQWLTYVHPVYKTPSRSIVALTAWAIVWTFLGDFQAIIDAFAYAMYTFYMLTIIALFILRRRYPDIPRPAKAWGYPVTPVVFLCIATYYIGSVLITKTMESLPGLFFLAAGLPLYFIWFRPGRRNTAM